MASRSEEASMIHFKQKTALVVDDYDVNRMVIGSRLEDVSVFSVEAASAAEALSIIESSEPFDFIFLDVNMDEIDGIEAARRMRAVEKCQKTKIIGISSYLDDNIRSEMITAGMNAAIEKPLTRDIIEALIC